MRKPNRNLYLLVCTLFVLTVFPAAGQETVNENELILIEEESSGLEFSDVPLISTWDFVQMIIILAVVIGVIYLIFFILKRGFRKRIPDNDLIRIIGSKSISGNRSLHLIELGRSLFLIGSADGGINLISEIKDQETLDIIRLEASETKEKMNVSFGNLLLGILKPGKKQKSDGIESVTFMKQQRERLKKL